MQLGTRWDAGGSPPPRLDAAFTDLIAEVELALPSLVGLRWTLTWLEGRPVAELDDGSVVHVVRVGHDGVPVVTIED